MAYVVYNSNSTLSTHSDHADNKTRLVTTIFLIMASDVVVLLSQLIDLKYFHFTAWGITSFTWAGQLLSLVLSAAIVATTMLASATIEDDTIVIFSLAIVSVILHSAFTASQFSVTLAYLMMKVNGS